MSGNSLAPTEGTVAPSAPEPAKAAAALAGDTSPSKAQIATLGAGCFWGVERVFKLHFGAHGHFATRVGYTGGSTTNPGYSEVSDGGSGHFEAVRITFDPDRVSYRELIEFFYKMHDPTTANSQGPDRGPQYRSMILFHSPEQEKVAREVTGLADSRWWAGPGRIVTVIQPAGAWYDAEDEHQDYLAKNRHGYECPTHFIRNFSSLL